MKAAAKAVPSPCIGICRMHETSGWCSGCLRTLDEIAAWSTLDEPAKLVVWRQLPARRGAARRLAASAAPPESPEPPGSGAP